MNTKEASPARKESPPIAIPKSVLCPECDRIVATVGKGRSAKIVKHNYPNRSRWNLYGPTGTCPGGGTSPLPILLSAARGELDGAVKKLESAAAAHEKATQDSLKSQQMVAFLEGLVLAKGAAE